MRILFDQGTPVEISAFLTKHTIRTTRQEGWETLANGDLLQAAEDAGFEFYCQPITDLDTNRI